MPHMDLVGEPEYIAEKGIYRLYVQEGTFQGQTVFMALVRFGGSGVNGKFKATRDEAITEGCKILERVHKEGERKFRESMRRNRWIRVKRFFYNLVPEFLRNRK